MVGSKVLLFPLPFAGHKTPMLHLGNALHSKGFSITVIHTHFNSPDPSEFPHFAFCFIEADGPTSDFVTILNDLNASASAPFRDCLSKVIEEPVACLIFDPFWQFAAGVAEEFNLPRIALRTGGLLAFIHYDALPLLREKGYFPIQEARKEEPVLEIPPLKVKDLTSEPYHESVVSMVRQVQLSTQGLICNSFEEREQPILERARQIAPGIPFFPIGPLHKYSSHHESSTNINIHHHTCLNWLETQALNSVLYVSFGTLATISKDEFLEVAWGLAKSEQPFIWVVKPNLINVSEKNDPLPDGFLKSVAGRGLIVPWAPQCQVLANPAVGGFWTHCGWNSTIESISQGVPMICSPFFGDQPPNARLVCDVLGMGLLLENGLERDEIDKVIRRLMREKEGQEMREKAEILKEKADQCIREGGSSCRSLDHLTTHILSFTCAQNHLKQ